jgi:hypothetical protein
VIVPLRSKRRERALLAQKLQHGAPAVVLLASGLQALREQPHGFALSLALFEVASSALLIGTVIRALRQARRPANAAASAHPHHGVDWIDVFTAGVLFAEAGERYHMTHHIARPTILMAVTLLTVGLLHGRILRRFGKRQTLRVEEDGLYVGGKPFRSITARWADVTSIDVGERYATILIRGGRQRKLDLSDLEGAQHVRHALGVAQGRLLPAEPAS